MQLIGMLDSPFVRRVAISLRLLGLAFEHRPISVFRDFEDFRRVNPVVKAPSLVCDDGEVLMDSTLILQYAERLASPRSLMPRDAGDYQHALRLLGLALAACEKSVQTIYEHQLRPQEKWHQPWLDRVHVQLLAAFAALEDEVRQRRLGTQFIKRPLRQRSSGSSRNPCFPKLSSHPSTLISLLIPRRPKRCLSLSPIHRRVRACPQTDERT